MPTMVICEQSGRGKAINMRLLAAAKDLSNNAVSKHKFGGGRKKKTSSLTDTIIERELQKNPRLTALALQNLYPGLLQPVKIRTVQHCLQKHLDLTSRKPAKKSLITERMKTKRLAFANKYSNGPLNSGGMWYFSMRAISKSFKMGSITVRRPRSSDHFDPRLTVSTVKHWQLVMVWVCFFGEKGRGGLYLIPKNKKMNAVLYLQVLEEHMLNFCNIHGSEVFMHDSAPCHKDRKITRYLQQKQVSVLEWPGNSPDLN